MTISLKADAGGTFGEILVNGSQVAKFTPGGNAVIPGAVGTVSQSGGVPTGAVVEQGSNANGRFVRFADGTQICTHAMNVGPWDANTSASAVWTFPAVFSITPNTVANGNTANPHAFNASALSSGGISVTVYYGGSSGASGTVELISVGRWF